MRSLEKPPYMMRVPRKSELQFYLNEVLPILTKRRVLQLTKFDYRLASDLDEELQRLRCRVNYHALRFTKPIQNLGQKIVMEMRKMATRFIAIHLRMVPLCHGNPLPKLVFLKQQHLQKATLDLYFRSL